MKRLFYTFAIALVVITGIAAIQAFATLREGTDVTVTTLRQANRLISSTNNNGVQIDGALICNMGEANDGQGCELKIQDSKTGKIFGLTNIDGAMRLFVAGNKKVSLTGKLTANNQIIEIAEVKAL